MTRVIALPPHQAWTFARLPDVLAEHHIEPRVVTHVGAHHGEEVAIYRHCRFRHIYLCEPDPRSLVVLHDRFGADPLVTIIGEAVTPHSWQPVTLHLAERTVWSGLQPHPTATGEQVEVPAVPIGELLAGTNVLVLDTQGSELALLDAADLDPLDLVIVETTRRRDDGAAFYDDAVAQMAGRGWQAAEEWVHDGSGYTDTVFAPA